MTETSAASMLVLDYWLLLRPAVSPDLWRFGAPIMGLLQQVGALAAACGEGLFTQQHFVQEVLRKLSLHQYDARLGHSVAGFFVRAPEVCLTRGLARPKAQVMDSDEGLALLRCFSTNLFHCSCFWVERFMELLLCHTEYLMCLFPLFFPGLSSSCLDRVCGSSGC
jgi:hypothetical protein